MCLRIRAVLKRAPSASATTGKREDFIIIILFSLSLSRFSSSVRYRIIILCTQRSDAEKKIIVFSPIIIRIITTSRIAVGGTQETLEVVVPGSRFEFL